MPLRVHRPDGTPLTSYNADTLIRLENLPYSKMYNISEDVIQIQLTSEEPNNLGTVLAAAEATGTEYRNPVKSIMQLRILSAVGANITYQLDQAVLDKVYRELFRVGLNVPRKSTKTITLHTGDTIESLLRHLTNARWNRNSIPNVPWTDELTDGERAFIVEHTPAVQQYMGGMIGLSGTETRRVEVSARNTDRFIPALNMVVPTPPGSAIWMAPGLESMEVPRRFEDVEDDETEDEEVEDDEAEDDEAEVEEVENQEVGREQQHATLVPGPASAEAVVLAGTAWASTQTQSYRRRREVGVEKITGRGG